MLEEGEVRYMIARVSYAGIMLKYVDPDLWFWVEDLSRTSEPGMYTVQLAT